MTLGLAEQLEEAIGQFCLKAFKDCSYNHTQLLIAQMMMELLKVGLPPRNG